MLVTTLTKRMAEDLTEYLTEHGVKVRYLHSDIDTLERIEIIRDLRLGVFDVLVGINLLREGLDIPECVLVAILDADKEGFLRSRNVVDPDHRPRRAQHRRAGDPVCRHDDRTACVARSRRPSGGAPSRRPGTKSTASRRNRSRNRSARCWRRCSSRTTSRSPRCETPACDGVRRQGSQDRPSRSWRSACAPPPPISNSRRPARLRDEIKRLEALDSGSSRRPSPPPSMRPRRDRTPEPLGPGGGGYDPSQAARQRRIAAAAGAVAFGFRRKPNPTLPACAGGLGKGYAPRGSRCPP